VIEWGSAVAELKALKDQDAAIYESLIKDTSIPNREKILDDFLSKIELCLNFMTDKFPNVRKNFIYTMFLPF
jgi:hypothetical protein